MKLNTESYCPTPDEIEKQKQLIRKSWTDTVKRNRVTCGHTSGKLRAEYRFSPEIRIEE